ncbi:MAG: sugar ABC transporter permease [Candidatus Omnitrophica bacterium]|nr:sugar ABC transporter permease [Candidatus Omnitrophota bacterium]
MRTKSSVKSTLENYLFILPAVAIFAIFYIYPFYETFNLGLRAWDGVSPVKEFVGLSNFKELFLYDQFWWPSMWHAGYITLIALTLQNALALSLALACDRAIRLGKFYRLVFFIPPVLSEVVVGLVWKWIFEPNYGLLNHWLVVLGLDQLVRSWLSSPQTALTCVAIIHSWKGFGWGFIILLAGLQTIDRQLYEAARVDGANSWQRFWHVTIPLMIPVFVLVSILTILGTMQAFVLVLTMTGGSPSLGCSVPVTRILGSMRASLRFGYACAQGIIFGIILLIVSFIQIRVSRKMKQA